MSRLAFPPRGRGQNLSTAPRRRRDSPRHAPRRHWEWCASRHAGGRTPARIHGCRTSARHHRRRHRDRTRHARRGNPPDRPDRHWRRSGDLRRAGLQIGSYLVQNCGSGRRRRSRPRSVHRRPPCRRQELPTGKGWQKPAVKRSPQEPQDRLSLDPRTGPYHPSPRGGTLVIISTKTRFRSVAHGVTLVIPLPIATLVCGFCRRTTPEPVGLGRIAGNRRIWPIHDRRCGPMTPPPTKPICGRSPL